MPDFTSALAAGLDAKRKVLQGASHDLRLLDHAPAGERGYRELAIVERGWFLKGVTGAPGELRIAELGFITEELLRQAVAFAIDGKVHKVDENSFDAPLVPTKRVWRFDVKPTSETISLSEPILTQQGDAMLAQSGEHLFEQ